MQASAFNRNIQRLGRVAFARQPRCSCRLLRSTETPNAWVGLACFSKIDCGRDCAPSDLPPRHPLIPSGRWDTLSSLAFGQGGIRTLGWFYPTHAFQASPIDRSGTCPAIAKHKLVQPLLRVDSPEVVLPPPSDNLKKCHLRSPSPSA